jgi:hypothetical protein
MLLFTVILILAKNASAYHLIIDLRTLKVFRTLIEGQEERWVVK